MDWKKTLRPAFKVLAKPGIGNPHGSDEVALLRAGAKPVGILHEIKKTELQTEIDNGQLCVIGQASSNTFITFRHRAEDNDLVQTIVNITQRLHFKEKLTDEENDLLKGLFPKPKKFCKADRMLELAWHSQRMRTMNTLFFYNFDDHKSKVLKQENYSYEEMAPIIEKMILNQEIPFQMVQGSTNQVYTHAHRHSTLQETRFKLDRSRTLGNVYVVAQTNKKKQGQELFDLHCKNILPPHIQKLRDDGASDAKISDEIQKTIGKLLGYTDNDIAWNLGEKYQNSLIMRSMKATNPLRQRARKELMIMDAVPPSPEDSL